MEETKLRKASKAYYSDALKSLKDFISINSIYDEKTVTSQTPFGFGVRKALDYIGNLATKMGFKVDYCDHYCTEISYGEGDCLDIYAHADVVPVSKDWKHDPFVPTIENDQMFGRGTSDDKGPAIAALYALKMIKDMGLIKGYKVRLIIGGNEERGSACLEHYFHAMKKNYPFYGFTPDGDFPLIYGEKGIYSYSATYSIGDKTIPSFNFGEATNIVLADANIILNDVENLREKVEKYASLHKDIKVTLVDNNVIFKGKACHGSVPWDGVNAGLHMLNFLGTVKNNKILCNVFADYEKGDGKNYQGDYSSTHFADSSYCIGKMEYDGDKLTVVVNMRLPETIDKNDAIKNVADKTGANIKYLGGSDALLVEPSSPLITLLMKAYQDETGDYVSKPEAIGGGTYARESKNSVAFGSKFVGRDNRIHDDEEFIDLCDFYNSISIYAAGIKYLGEDIARKRK